MASYRLKPFAKKMLSLIILVAALGFVWFKYSDSILSYINSEKSDSVGVSASDPSVSINIPQKQAAVPVKSFGVDPSRFIILGNGPDNPLPDADNRTQEGRERNRRTEISFKAI